MTDAIKHRGPDGEGFYVHENIGFGHRRLAIIDLSEAGRQPMEYMGCTITYNGEIYNYLELRSALQQAGYTFRTATDTEVLLAAYHHWGTDCVQHFNGMWAFAIYDPAKQTVFFSRDRFGEKPFYYHYSGGRLLFCSELKGLLPAMAHGPRPNLQMSARFLVFEKAEHREETFFEGVQKLPAGHNMVVALQQGKLALSPYYHPEQNDTFIQADEDVLCEQFRAALSQSIALRMRSDVAVGTCLSGGLDSSALACLASEMAINGGRQGFAAVTAGNPDPAKDERPFAQMVVNSCGLSWHTIVPGREDYLQAFDTVLNTQEEPFHSPSILMQHFVMRTASRAGLKVLLDGQGADELMLGYQPHLAWCLNTMPVPVRIREGLRAMDHYRLSIVKLLLLMGYHSQPRRKRNRQLARFPALQPALRDLLRAEMEAEACLPGDIFSRQVYELFNGSLPMLLRYEDKNAMAFSVETRLPFLDPSLVELLLNLPARMKIRQGWSKYLLRVAMQNRLPAAIAWRKGKIGFEAMASWQLLKHFNWESCRPGSGWLEEVAGKKPDTLEGEQAWRGYTLAMWYNKWFQS